MGRVYDLKAWKQVRDVILSSHPLCVRCKAQGIVTIATEVDHIHPISKGGDAWDTDNLMPLCKPCHSAKTAVDAGRSRGLKGCDTTGTPLDPQHPWNR